jgi:hypothetical protein
VLAHEAQVLAGQGEVRGELVGPELVREPLQPLALVLGQEPARHQ